MRKMHKTIATILTAIMSITIFTGTAAASEAVSQETVKEVQQALNDAGFDCGTPDGIAGKGTAAAVSAYQEANGLPVDGQISDTLLISLGLLDDENEAGSAEAVDDLAVNENEETPEGYSYQGKWVTFRDVYEIYIPSGADVELGEEIQDVPNCDTLYAVWQEGEDNGKVYIQSFAQTIEAMSSFMSEEQVIEFYKNKEAATEVMLNDATAYYSEDDVYDRVSLWIPDPETGFFISCEGSVHDVDMALAMNTKMTDRELEICREIVHSVRYIEETEVETDTFAAEEEPAEENSTEDTSEVTENGEWEEDVYPIDANGQQCGVTDEEYEFEWNSNKKSSFQQEELIIRKDR